MLTVERIVAFCVGALALLKDVIHKRQGRSVTDAALLRELAREKSASVPDLSSRAKVSQPVALVALMSLRNKGWSGSPERAALSMSGSRRSPKRVGRSLHGCSG